MSETNLLKRNLKGYIIKGLVYEYGLVQLYNFTPLETMQSFN